MTVLTPPGYVQGGTYTAKLDRVYLATLGKIPNLAATFSARQGFFGGRVPAYANPSGMNITMGACGAVIANTFASASGDYLMANDATVQVTLAASSPTQNRYDIVGFQVKDNLFDSSGLNTAVPTVIQGANSAGTPSDPALPASFIPVLRAVVNATNTSPASLQSLIRKTAEEGGLLRIASVTERAEITAYAGLAIYREDRNWIEVYDGTAWRVHGLAKGASIADLTSAVTNPYGDQLATASDINMLCRWDNTAWVGIQPLGGISAAHRRDASFQRTTNQSIPSNAPTPLEFPGTPQGDSVDVVPSGTNQNTFTLNRIGLWRVSAGTRMGGGGGAERSLEVNNISDSVLLCSANSTGQGVANLNCGRDFRVSATGKQFQAAVYQATGSNQDAIAANTFISWTWLRP
jgi:hypothetical protein